MLATLIILLPSHVLPVPASLASEEGYTLVAEVDVEEARRLLDMGELDKAVGIIDQIIKTHPDSFDALNMRGIALIQKSMIDKAILSFSQAISINPKYDRAFSNRGHAYIQLGRIDLALADLKRACELTPGSWENWYRLGKSKNFLSSDFVGAISEFDAAIKLNPQCALLFHDRGRAWSGANKSDKAILDFDEAIRLDRASAATYVNRGAEWERTGKHVKAMDDYDTAIKLDEKFIGAYLNRSQLWIKLKKPHNAIQDYSMAIKLDPRDSNLLLCRGLLLSELGDYSSAIKDFESAILLDSQFSDAFAARSWIRSSCVVSKYRSKKLAIENAQRACELSAWKNMGYLEALAAAHAAAGDYKEAVRWQSLVLRDSNYCKMIGESAKSRLKLYEQNLPYRLEAVGHDR